MIGTTSTTTSSSGSGSNKSFCQMHQMKVHLAGKWGQVKAVFPDGSPFTRTTCVVD